MATATPLNNPNPTAITTDARLTGAVKDFALRQLEADLVGVANIERFEKAPEMMSPQGILPSARSVVVMAIHHPDACIELGGLTHPQEIGPYRVQYQMNNYLDEISYKMGLFLERAGWRAVPIVSSNIWRYKGFKDLTEHFAPDISHLHSAVAAGLSEFGINGLSITPEYGARQRYVSIITDAPLVPTPLLEPGSVCDGCNLCVKECRSGALSKELDGWKVVEIEDKTYRYLNKNLWRCSWGEHFDLDLDLEIPEKVDEAVILENVAKYGKRGGEMGSCLRYCVPKARRYFDREYTNAPRRKRDVVPADGPVHRGLQEGLVAAAVERGCDFAVASGKDRLAGMGIDASKYLPDAVSAFTIGLHFDDPKPREEIDADTRAENEKKHVPNMVAGDPTAPARDYILLSTAFNLTRRLERAGYTAICCTEFPESDFAAKLGAADGRKLQTATVLTNAELRETPMETPAARASAPATSPKALRAQVEGLLRGAGADLVGVAPAARIQDALGDIAAVYDGEEVIDARDVSPSFTPYDPEVATNRRRVTGPASHLTGAQSVLVIGLRMPEASVERTAKPPALPIGPYAFAEYESINLLRILGYRAMRLLQDAGHRATLTFDLCNTGSFTANPRGPQPDAFSNRFAAVAAGLGRLGRGGFVLTDDFGPRVRFVAVVTDAEVAPNATLPVDGVPEACTDCARCVESCLGKAFRDEEAEIRIDGATTRFRPFERKRCDWVKRYSLVGASGTGMMGWKLDEPVPAEVTPENLAEALRKQPSIEKYRPCSFESCLLACPEAREQ